MPSRRDLLSTVGGLGVAGVAGVVASKTEYAPSNPPAVSDPPTGPDAWPLPRFDARNTGRNPDATVPRETPTAAWTLSLPYVRQPLLAAGRVALRTGRTVSVREADTGAEAWRRPSDSAVDNGLAVGGETLYAPSGDAFVGYDLPSGEEVWRADWWWLLNSGTPTVAEGAIHALSRGGHVRYDADGRAVWFSQDGYSDTSAPAVEDGVAYHGSIDRVTALDTTAAAVEWPWEDSDEEYPPSPKRGRAERWHVRHDRLGFYPRWSPALTDEYVVAAGDSRFGTTGVRLLRRSDGRPNTPFALGEARDERGAATPPVLLGDRTLAVAGNDHVLRRLPFGESTASRWRTPLSYHPTHLVAGAETIVCAGFDDHETESDARKGRVGAYDRETGETLWELTLGSSVRGLAVADGVYVTRRTTWSVADDGTPMGGADAAHPTVTKLA